MQGARFDPKPSQIGEKDKKKRKTSSAKGNDAHLRAIIQREKKWKHQFFRRLRAAYSVVCGPCSDLAEFQTHPSSYVCHHYL